jgi:hypothetical protein
MRATTRFGALLAAGITAMVVGQASINIAGVTGVMPLTGIPLPLVSYGGSSLIVTLTALGLLANVATERRPSRAVEVTVADERRITIDGDDDLDEASIDYLAEDDDDSNSEYDSADAAPIAGARGGWRHRRASRAGARRR